LVQRLAVTIVVNASPLIVLGKAGLLHIIGGVGDRVYIPASVAHEVKIGNDLTADWLRLEPQNGWVVEDPTPDPFVLAWDLGAGETAVLSIPSGGVEVVRVLDDRAARRCAECLSLPVVGTVGLILMAKRLGLLPTVSEALESVIRAGLFISPRHLEAVRLAAGEGE